MDRDFEIFPGERQVVATLERVADAQRARIETELCWAQSHEGFDDEGDPRQALNAVRNIAHDLAWQYVDAIHQAQPGIRLGPLPSAPCVRKVHKRLLARLLADLPDRLAEGLEMEEEAAADRAELARKRMELTRTLARKLRADAEAMAAD